jgi:hypothetical protein
MSVTTFIIYGVSGDYTAEKIARDLWTHGITQVSMITIMPYLLNNEELFLAYIDVTVWADSERAYDIIQHLRQQDKIDIVVNNRKWTIKPNTHNNGVLMVFGFTTPIPAAFYVEEDDEVLMPRRLEFESETEALSIV